MLEYLEVVETVVVYLITARKCTARVESEISASNTNISQPLDFRPGLGVEFLTQCTIVNLNCQNTEFVELLSN